MRISVAVQLALGVQKPGVPSCIVVISGRCVWVFSHMPVPRRHIGDEYGLRWRTLACLEKDACKRNWALKTFSQQSAFSADKASNECPEAKTKAQRCSNQSPLLHSCIRVIASCPQVTMSHRSHRSVDLFGQPTGVVQNEILTLKQPAMI